MPKSKALVELIKRTKQDDERPVVCGDFNVLPDSVTFDALGALGLTDLVTARGYTDTRTSYYEKTPRFADYMFISPEIEVRHFEVCRRAGGLRPPRPVAGAGLTLRPAQDRPPTVFPSPTP